MSAPDRPMDELAGSILSLAHRAVEVHAPLVESMIKTEASEIRDIERTLDGLLGFCFDPRALLLYRKLCRHYFLIDPAATSEYIRAYREMWDSKEDTPLRADAPSGQEDGE